MQTALQIIQTLREAETRAGYDAAQAYGQKVISVLDGRAELARVSLPLEYAQSWVVTLAPVTLPGQQGAAAAGGFNPQVIADARGVVEWGMGGSTSWAVVDWTSGQQFSVFGSFVRLIGQLVAWPINGAPVDPEARFAGHLVPGRSINVAVRTVSYGAVLAPLGTLRLAVPAFARSVSAHIQTGAGISDGDLQLFGENRSGDTIWNITLVPGDSGSRVFLLPVGTNFINLRNVDAVNSILTPSLRYELALS